MKTLFLVGILATIVYGQVSVEIQIGDRRPSPPDRVVVVQPPPERVIVVEAPQGYVEDYEPREDLIVIEDNLVGYWVKLSSGRFILRCRNVWYDDHGGRIFYGPWREEHHYVHHHNYVHYDNHYRWKHYPKCHRYQNGPRYDGPKYRSRWDKDDDDWFEDRDNDKHKHKHGHKNHGHGD